ncbi:hypothetical protein JVT61DRAFT_12146 [Boletus reticuloceps]|uniref:Uncharacterized protein n=1 Tax=Boletus reticuloceps TaxID=495285 RepID=A0A8I3A568_9AGAM|nr:hypothetical protein JVT61DRAFT_12146 [Boletus reticuloceps]
MTRPSEIELVSKALRLEHAPVVDHLEVIIHEFNSWSVVDIVENQKGGILTYDITALPGTFQEIKYDLQAFLKTPDIWVSILQRYKVQFDRIFRPAKIESSMSLVGHWEFSAFNNALGSVSEDMNEITNYTTSAIKAANFVTYFLQPPFLSSHNCIFQVSVPLYVVVITNNPIRMQGQIVGFPHLSKRPTPTCLLKDCA